MAKDFLDDDLRTPELEPPDDVEEKDGVPIRPITEASLTRMARQKKEIREQVSGTLQEIESLRRKQEELEKAKSALEELRRKQDEYEHGKRDMIEKMSRAVILSEKEEAQATRVAELMASMRSRFKEALAELRSVDESRWSDVNYEAELNKAMVLVEDAKAVYRRALAKVDAEAWQKGEVGQVHPATMEAEAQRQHVERRGFPYWLMVGCAVTIPLAVAAVVIAVFFHVLARL